MSTLGKIRLRMCEADRDAYGDPPKAEDGWVTFDPEALAELPASKLEDVETTTGFRIAYFWMPSQRISARGQRAALWIARMQAGAVDEWSSFDPRVLQVETEIIPAPKPASAAGGGGADPPADGSATGSPAAP